MRKLACKNNDKFGYWVVINNNPVIKNGHTYVTVKCKCGKIQDICLSDLVHKRTTGCKKCKGVERRNPNKIKIGQIVKNWIVLNGPKLNKNDSYVWEIRCTICNNSTRWIQGNELTNPNKCFKCRKCAAIARGTKVTLKNGRIGELTKAKRTKIKTCASDRDLIFNVSIKFLWELFILQNRCCAITGDKLSNINNASLDRINSNLGYIENNVQWVTKQANLSKHVMSTKEFILFCQKVIDNANQQPS